MEPPAVARPVAAARESRKKWEIAETAGVKIREVPMPPRREKVRMKCQYSIRRDGLVGLKEEIMGLPLAWGSRTAH